MRRRSNRATGRSRSAPGGFAAATSVVEHPERPGFELVKRVVHVPGDPARERWWTRSGSRETSPRPRPIAGASDRSAPTRPCAGPARVVGLSTRGSRPLGVSSGIASVAAFPISPVAFAVPMIRTRCRGLVGAMIPDRCCCPRVPATAARRHPSTEPRTPPAQSIAQQRRDPDGRHHRHRGRSGPVLPWAARRVAQGAEGRCPGDLLELSRPIPGPGRTSRPGPSSRATSSWTRARPRASTAT